MTRPYGSDPLERLTTPRLFVRGVLAGMLVAGGLAGCTGSGASQLKWGYGADDGPGKWGALSADYAICEAGVEQSPIDLAGAKGGALPALKLDWSSGPAQLKDTGRAIQVDLPQSGAMTLGENTYQLVQFHVHTPSEHLVDGEPAPLEVHFVHADATGKLAVVGVMVREGAAHSALDPIVAGFDGLKPGGPALAMQSFDPGALLPETDGRMSYPGSLTTPPCSEDVAWTVMTSPISASKAQIDAFVARYPDNARPVMPLGDRSLLVDTPPGS